MMDILKEILNMLKNLFGGQKSQNPLDGLSSDDLKLTRVKLERTRDRLIGEIKKMEADKADLFKQGVGQSEMRVQRLMAQRIKEMEERIRQADLQLSMYNKQLLAVGRLEHIKKNRNDVVGTGLEKLMDKMDTGDLRNYIEDIAAGVSVDTERLDELVGMLGEATNMEMADDDPEITALIQQMQVAGMHSMDQLDHVTDAADSEGPVREGPERL